MPPSNSPPWRPAFGLKQFEAGVGLVSLFRRYMAEEGNTGAGCEVVSDLLAWIEPALQFAYDGQDERELTTLVNTLKAVNYHMPHSLHWFKWDKESEKNFQLEAERKRAAMAWLEIPPAPVPAPKPPPHPRQMRKRELFAEVSV